MGGWGGGRGWGGPFFVGGLGEVKASGWGGLGGRGKGP